MPGQSFKPMGGVLEAPSITPSQGSENTGVWLRNPALPRSHFYSSKPRQAPGEVGERGSLSTG